MTAAEFRAQYPEFADTTKYSDVQVTRLIGFATQQLPADRWQDMLDEGIGLFVAHSLAVNRSRVVAANKGGTPGAITGVVTSKAVDKVSVSYDVSTVTLADAGYWGLTAYGIQLLTWARMVGAGGVQL